MKPAPGDHESNFKKVGSIPFGFNTMGTLISSECLIEHTQVKNTFETDDQFDSFMFLDLTKKGF